jgi:hypothetical protein
MKAVLIALVSVSLLAPAVFAGQCFNFQSLPSPVPSFASGNAFQPFIDINMPCNCFR